MAALTSRIDGLQQDLQSIFQEALKDEDSRKQLLKVVMQGMATLDSPLETIWRLIMTVREIFSVK